MTLTLTHYHTVARNFHPIAPHNWRPFPPRIREQFKVLDPHATVDQYIAL